MAEKKPCPHCHGSGVRLPRAQKVRLRANEKRAETNSIKRVHCIPCAGTGSIHVTYAETSSHAAATGDDSSAFFPWDDAIFMS